MTFAPSVAITLTASALPAQADRGVTGTRERGERQFRFPGTAPHDPRLSKVTGTEVSEETIRYLQSEGILPKSTADFHDLGGGLREPQKPGVVRAALAIAVADGRIAPEERGFLDQLTLGLTIPVIAIGTVLQNAGLSGVSAAA